MDPPTVTAAIIDDNATRAELYGHWLDHMDVRIAVTKRQVVEEIDDDVTVAILAEEFADGAAEKVLQLIRARTRYCQVLTTTETRGQVVPQLDVTNHVTKPIFKDELRERVEGLARQTVYAELLEAYYRSTAQLTALRKSENPPEDAADRIERLDDRVDDLQPMLAGIRAELDQEDVAAVGDLLTREREIDEEAAQQSKYVPEKCFNCGQAWSVSSSSGRDTGVVRLGSHVWRCTNCGHIQMGATAGNPRLTHSK